MGMLNAWIWSFGPVSAVLDVAFLLLVYVVFSFIFSSKNHRQGPPGPKPLPLIGNLLQLDFKRLDKTFLQFSKQYGSVFTVHLGPKKAVVLVGYETMKEAFVNYADEFGDRVVPLVAKEANLDHGLAWSNGDSWKEMRRFALTNLKDFGMGKRACEDKIIEETRSLIQEFKKFKGEAFDMTQLMNYAVSNIICSMVYGSRFEYEDPEFQTIVTQTCKGLTLLASPAIKMYNLFPSTGKLLFSARKTLRNVFEDTKRNHIKLLNRLKETLNPQMCRSVADVFMVRQQQLKESGVSNSYYTKSNLLATVIQLFAAGTETTSITLQWALLYMAKYPKIQAKVQEELSRVIGGRQVQVQDTQNLPFTNAVLHETQRLANIVPLALIHRTSRDVVFQGYFIAKVRLYFFNM